MLLLTGLVLPTSPRPRAGSTPWDDTSPVCSGLGGSSLWPSWDLEARGSTPDTGDVRGVWR